MKDDTSNLSLPEGTIFTKDSDIKKYSSGEQPSRTRATKIKTVDYRKTYCKRDSACNIKLEMNLKEEERKKIIFQINENLK